MSAVEGLATEFANFGDAMRRAASALDEFGQAFTAAVDAELARRAAIRAANPRPKRFSR